jgi:predicted membrane-bound mannosyltransferase
MQKVQKIEIMYNTYYLDSKFDSCDCHYKPPTNTGGFLYKIILIYFHLFGLSDFATYLYK